MNINAKKSPRGSVFGIRGILLIASLTASQTGNAEQAQLVAREHLGNFARVKTVVDMAGSLNVRKATTPEVQNDDGKERNADSKKNETESEDRERTPEVQIPLKVDAEMFFDEVGVQADNYSTLRHYWDAKADLKINEAVAQTRELRSDRQLLLLSSGLTAADRVTSPYGPLTREEIELVDVASNGFPPELLLPNRAVQTNETWSHENDVVAGLLRIEKITRGELKSTVTEIGEAKVLISLAGNVEGEIEGVASKFEVKGNYKFDRKAKMVTWIALAIREQRDVSLAAPGFHVVSRIRTAREPIEKSEMLTPEVLARTNLRRSQADLLLEFVSEDQNFQMATDRRWHLLSHRRFSSKLRMVDDGDLLATCRIDYLTKGVPGTQITLDGFRDDVQRALAKSCKEIVSAGQSVNSQGVRVLRVEASGEVAETPITWVYYHLSDDEGHRLSFVYTLESSMMSRFDAADQEMTSSVFFLDSVSGDPPEAEVSRLNGNEVNRN